MPIVRILHISDLHIAKYPYNSKSRLTSGDFPSFMDSVMTGTYAASHSTGRLAAIVNLVYNKIEELDAIVITGDIATTGLDYDLQKALRFIAGTVDVMDQRSSDGFPTISGSNLKVILLPGNHDRYNKLLNRLGYSLGGKMFHQVFRQHWVNDVKADSIIKGDTSVGIIAADFSLKSWRDCEFPRALNMYAQGRVYETVLKDLIRETESFIDSNEDKNRSVIWALHFPPVSPQITSYMKLIDDQLLLKAAKQHSVSMILSGHTHHPFEYSSPKTTCRISCAGSASQYDTSEGNYCHVINISSEEEGDTIRVEHYKFSEKRAKFVLV